MMKACTILHYVRCIDLHRKAFGEYAYNIELTQPVGKSFILSLRRESEKGRVCPQRAQRLRTDAPNHHAYDMTAFSPRAPNPSSLSLQSRNHT